MWPDWERIAPGALAANGEIGLVGFHSMFNAIGVFCGVAFSRIRLLA